MEIIDGGRQRYPLTYWPKGIKWAKEKGKFNVKFVYTYLWNIKGCGFGHCFFYKCITELDSKGVYAEALIKKQCYWPKVVHGYLINNHYQDK